MRSAPPVQMTCGRDAGWNLLETLLHALAAASFSGWIAARVAPAAALACAAVAAFAAAALVWWLARARPLHRLAWDGHQWLLNGQAVDLSLMMAGQTWALARARAPAAAATTWLPVRLSACGAPPHLARAALLAHG